MGNNEFWLNLMIGFINIVINLLIIYHVLIKPLEKQHNRIEEKLDKLLEEKEEKNDNQE